MDLRTRLLAGHPSGVTGVRGDAAVGGHGPLGDDVGGLGGDEMEEGRIQRIAFRTQEIFDNLDSRFAQARIALAAHERIRVARPHDHARDARLHQRIRARGLGTEMAARFQGDEDGGAFGRLGARRERIALGMQIAITLMAALADNPAVLHHDRTHHGVGIHPSMRRARKLYCAAHMRLGLGEVESLYRICHHLHHFPSSGRLSIVQEKEKPACSAGDRNAGDTAHPAPPPCKCSSIRTIPLVPESHRIGHEGSRTRDAPITASGESHPALNNDCGQYSAAAGSIQERKAQNPRQAHRASIQLRER